jgi:hypothetical protein
MRRVGLGVMAVVCGAVTFAPWMRSGSARRSSFEVVRAAQDLDVLHGWVQPTAAAGWYFLPLLLACVLLAVVLDRTILAGGLLAVAGISVALLALKLTVGGTTAEWGAPAGLIGGSLALVAAAEVMIHERRTRARRTPTTGVVAGPSDLEP